MTEAEEPERRRPGIGRVVLTAFAWGIGLGFLVTLLYIALR